MAIQSCLTTSFKSELLSGTHQLATHVLKIALYSSSASLGPDTTAYTTTGEVSGTGYSAGGSTLSGAAISTQNGVAFVDFSDVTWPSSTITARGAMIYNSSASNRAIAIMDFGTDRSSSNTTFSVVFPDPTGTAAIIRLA